MSLILNDRLHPLQMMAENQLVLSPVPNWNVSVLGHRQPVSSVFAACREGLARTSLFQSGSGDKAPCTNRMAFLQAQNQLLPQDHSARAFRTWDRQTDPFSLRQRTFATSSLSIERALLGHTSM
jgi:hypothetical protein